MTENSPVQVKESDTNKVSLKKVETFWDANLCGSHFVDDKIYTKDFFDNYRAFRYKKEHHLLKLIDWESAKGKDVLEIGLGVGADGTKWATHAQSYTGLDLTAEAVYATGKHLELLGLKGKIVQGNAEAMPFKDNQFDLLYSHGVLHHSPNIENTFKEVSRVLKPNGEFIIMLYSKASFNYWARIQFYLRFRLIFEILKSKIGMKSGIKYWQLHLNNFEKMGWKYLSWTEFPHHCTDGPECSIANIYYKETIINKLKKHGLSVERTRRAHIPVTGGRFPNFEYAIGKYLGFYEFYWGKKQ